MEEVHKETGDEEREGEIKQMEYGDEPTERFSEDDDDKLSIIVDDGGYV